MRAVFAFLDFDSRRAKVVCLLPNRNKWNFAHHQQRLLSLLLGASPRYLTSP
jgi:hypothetical protein